MKRYRLNNANNLSMMAKMSPIPINFIFVHMNHWFTHFIPHDNLSLVRIQYLHDAVYQTLIIILFIQLLPYMPLAK